MSPVASPTHAPGYVDAAMVFAPPEIITRSAALARNCNPTASTFPSISSRAMLVPF